MQTLELNKMGLESLSEKEKKENFGGSSLAYDIGRCLRFACITLYHGPMYGGVMAGADFCANRIKNSK
jgi:hypothetical protein